MIEAVGEKGGGTVGVGQQAVGAGGVRASVGAAGSALVQEETPETQQKVGGAEAAEPV